ncbi:aldo/keto reductase [Cyclobacterium qasimii]|uniref:Aldo/keto reductase n=2 Tax=Cyclobacterium qasimii TaxID=1350429 RepID=S7VD32_9BACT|nr:aldo/keto reductase [Cyclobacterium qasimii]EPR67482.1 Aldo/keto reductase [Cyclobacterium qasimii M12-11B]GEO21771.1 aldo/keto reductase [Cyclobacterium qasimii]
MKYRKLGKTEMEVSEVSLGTWQVGGGWGGRFDHNQAYKILNEAIDQGVNFIDTADVYDGGLSEQAVGKVVKERTENVFVATKCGRQIQPHTNEGYTPEVLRTFVETSLRNLRLEALDLIQLHCPPTMVFERPEIFGLFEDLKTEGKIKHLGVSVEKVAEAIRAMEYSNVATIQVIFNMFRLKPAEELFDLALQNNCGVIARVPLASGLLSGKITSETVFHPEDHRTFNRAGEAFDKGETFSGVPLHKGIEAVEELKALLGVNRDLASLGIKWVLMFGAISTVIPGASKVDQVRSNVSASALPEFTVEEMEGVKAIYDKYLRSEVHGQW